jgi:hypothetical protein
MRFQAKSHKDLSFLGHIFGKTRSKKLQAINLGDILKYEKFSPDEPGIRFYKITNPAETFSFCFFLNKGAQYRLRFIAEKN